MTADTANRAQFRASPLDDGNVELVIALPDNQFLAARMTPEQVGAVATNLLNCAHDAFQFADKSLPDGLSVGRITPVRVTRWTVATPPDRGHLAVVFHSGEASIACSVSNADARSVARTLVEGSYHLKSVPVRTYVADALRDCWSVCRATSGILVDRLKDYTNRNTSRFVDALTGRSPRIFRRVAINSGSSLPKYPPISHCIYCGDKTYSASDGARAYPLGAEHIVPEGIGGTLVLPQASCQRHEDITGRLIEGDVLGRTLKALRVHLKLKKRGSGSHPKSLPLDATIDGVERRIDVATEDYPIVFMMLHYVPPTFVPSHVNAAPSVNGVTAAVLRHDQKALYKKYRATSFATASWDSVMFCRMLAKIGHAFAVAELGPNAFRPALLDLICDGNVAAMNLVGGERLGVPTLNSVALHELQLGYQRESGKTYIIARIRLFARHGGPTYSVVVGEALVSRLAILKRRISNWMR